MGRPRQNLLNDIKENIAGLSLALMNNKKIADQNSQELNKLSSEIKDIKILCDYLSHNTIATENKNVDLYLLLEKICQKIERIDVSIESIKNDYHLLKKETTDIGENVSSMRENNVMIMKDLRILRSEQQSIIKSMIKEGKTIQPCNESDNLSPSILFPYVHNNHVSSKKNLNLSLMNGWAPKFVP